jgi:hypothetical protein
MSLCKSSFILMTTLFLFENQIQQARADAQAPGTASSTVSVSSGVSGTLALPTIGIEQNRNSLRSDRAAIQEDRANVRTDRADIEKNRKDIRAAEHDIQINPMNKSSDQARIAADQKSIRSERQDLMKSDHQLHHDQQALRSAINQQRNLRQSSGSTSQPLYSNGFFPPTHKPASNQNGGTGFGGELHHHRPHLAR